jgi:hypothetical protein
LFQSFDSFDAYPASDLYQNVFYIFDGYILLHCSVMVHAVAEMQG